MSRLLHPCQLFDQAQRSVGYRLRPAAGRVSGIGPVQSCPANGLGPHAIDGRHAPPGCATGPDPRAAPDRPDVALLGGLGQLHEGMLFVFEQASTQCFWMRNTLIPLTAAFVEDDGTIVNLADMQPQSDDSHCSSKPVRFVLEMNQGWFAKRQIKPGAKLGGTVFSKRPS